MILQFTMQSVVYSISLLTSLAEAQGVESCASANINSNNVAIFSTSMQPLKKVSRAKDRLCDDISNAHYCNITNIK